MRLAFESAASKIGVFFECVFSSEIDERAKETYELNFDETPSGDITRMGKSLPGFDFLLAGFPCQPFSYAGKKRGFGDTRGTLFFEVEKILEKHRPHGFLLENVRGLISHDGGRTLETILERLRKLGYATKHVVCNSSDFDVPQNRVRVYIIGVLGEDVQLSIKSSMGAADSHRFKKENSQFLLLKSEFSPKTVADILKEDVDKKYNCSPRFTKMLIQAVERPRDLHGMRLIDYRGGHSLHSWDLGLKGRCSRRERQFMNKFIMNRRRKVFGKHQDGKMLNAEQIKTFFEGSDLEDVLQSLVTKGYLKERGGRYNPVCGNMSFEIFKFLDPESISVTLTSSDAHRLGVVQNGIPRRITPREAARLQGFPETFILHPDDMANYRQMGNAVSVPVVEKIVSDLFQRNEKIFPTQEKLRAKMKVQQALARLTAAEA